MKNEETMQLIGSNVVIPTRLPGESNDSPAIRRAIDAVKENGGTVYFCESKYYISEPIIIYRDVCYVGRGIGQTTIYVEKGANCDAFRTYDFDLYVNQKLYGESVDENFGPNSTLPQNFVVKGMTVDCGADFVETEIPHTFKCTGNTKGYGFKIFGKRYITSEIQVQNVPEVGFYTEFNSGEVVTVANSFNYFIGSRISVRVISSGEEGMIYRGPSDQRIDDIWICSSCLTNKTTVFADREDWELAAVVFDDRDARYGSVPYCASPELGFGHVWRGFNCWGIVVCGYARFKADHLIIESTNGGFKNSNFSYSQIGILDVHDCRFGDHSRPYIQIRSKTHTKISNLEIRFSRETSNKNMVQIDGDNVIISECLLRGDADLIGLENAGGHGVIINGNFNQILGLHGMHVEGKGTDGAPAAAVVLNGSRNVVRGIAHDCTVGAIVNNGDNTLDLTVSRVSERGARSVIVNAENKDLLRVRLNDFDRTTKARAYYPATLAVENAISLNTAEVQQITVEHGLPFVPDRNEIVPVFMGVEEDVDLAYVSVNSCDEKNVYLSAKLAKTADTDQKIGVTVHIGK